MNKNVDPLEAAIDARDRAAIEEAEAFAKLDRIMKEHSAMGVDPNLDESRDALEAYNEWEYARAHLETCEREVFRLRSLPSNDNDGRFDKGP